MRAAIKAAATRPGLVAGALLAAILLLAPAVMAQIHRSPPEEEAGPIPARDPREVELLRYDCRSDISRREVTLFANGTVRLRQGPPGAEEMTLAELEPEILDGLVHRLRRETKPDVGDLEQAGPDGAWVDECTLALDLPGEGFQRFRLRRLGTTSLALSRLIALAEDVAAAAQDAVPDRILPADYQPRIGDILERRDGVHFELVRPTLEGMGWELQGVEQPITLFIAADDLRTEFAAVVRRRGR